MAENMINRMQEFMDVNIEKIDASDATQSMPEQPERVDFIAQATIPTALIGTLVKLTKISADHLESMSALSFTEVFGKRKEEVAQSVADFAQTTYENADAYLKRTFDALNEILNKRFNGDLKAMRHDLEAGQNVILSYLPSKVNLGATVDISSIDDPTHKMNGILSSITNFLFNEDINTKEKNR